jgi:hypothetical protein
VVDANLLVREFLLSQTAVTSLLGTNANGSIYCGYDLPEHFDPELGPAIQVFRVGGSSHTEITQLVDARVQVRVWADVEKPLLASEVYGAINDVLHGLCQATLAAGTIIRALEVTAPQEMTDPDTAWVAVYAFYEVMARPNGSGEAPAGPPQLIQGAGAPQALSSDGDIYFDTDSGDIYEQVNGSWGSPVGTITGGGGDEMPSTPYHRISTADNNAHVIKSSAGTVSGWNIFNDGEYPIFVKLYDKATLPNPASDTPKQVIGVQGGTSVAVSGNGFTYLNGIGLAIVANIGDSDNTAVTAGAITADIFFQ